MDNGLILVADADKRFCNLIGVTLSSHDYKCITANSGESAVLLSSSNSPDAVILELALPDMDGTEVIKTIRSWSDVPIIVISERKEDSDKVMALDSGADDYLVKPFSIEELLARLRAIKRRSGGKAKGGEGGSVFENGVLRIDYAAGCVYASSKEIHLTPIEYRLLCVFASNAGRVLTHAFITQEIWGNSWDSNVYTLRTFMASLRKKLAAVGADGLIMTHTGVGYRMVKHEGGKVY